MITKDIIRHLLSDKVNLHELDYQLHDDLSELYIPDPFKVCDYRCFPTHSRGWIIKDLEIILENLLKAPKVYIRKQIPIRKYEFNLYESYFYGDTESKQLIISLIKSNHNVKHILYDNTDSALYELNNPTINGYLDFFDMIERNYYDLSPITLK